MQFGFTRFLIVFPCRNKREVFIISECFTLRCLGFFSEVTSTRFCAFQGIFGKEFTQLQKVCYSKGFCQWFIKWIGSARHKNIFIKLFAQCFDFCYGFFKSFFVAWHSTFIPNNFSEFSMEIINRFCSLVIDKSIDLCSHIRLCFFKFRGVGRDWSCTDIICQIISDGVWQNKITICQALHQCRGTKSVGTMVRKVGLPYRKATWYCCHQVVINPNTSHGVVNSWVDHHRGFVRVLIDNFFIHLKQVAIFCFDDLFAKFLYKCIVVFVQSFDVCFFFAISLNGCSKI